MKANDMNVTTANHFQQNNTKHTHMQTQAMEYKKKPKLV